MKFTKEQAVEEITAKISDKDKDLDLSRTISECVENTLKVVGENEDMELTDFVALVQPLVATAAGLAHKTGKTATETLQKKIAELEGKLNPDTKKDDEPKDELKSLRERLERLEKEKEENDKRTKISAKRNEIAEAIKKLGVDDKDWVDAVLGKASVTDDTDVENEAKDYVAIYNKSHSVDSSITPRLTGGDDTGKYDLSGLDAALGQMRGPVASKTE